MDRELDTFAFCNLQQGLKSSVWGSKISKKAPEGRDVRIWTLNILFGLL